MSKDKLFSQMSNGEKLQTIFSLQVDLESVKREREILIKQVDSNFESSVALSRDNSELVFRNSELEIKTAELLEALELADKHRGMVPAEVAEKIHNAIAKAKS